MIRLIGLRWTHGNMWSREVLIVRGLVIVFFKPVVSSACASARVLRHLFQYSQMASLFIFQLLLRTVGHIDVRVDHIGSTLLKRNAGIPPLLISQQPNNLLVTIARGTHLFPFRTESLSPVAPMVLHLNWCGRVGSRQVFFSKPLSSRIRALLF